MGNAQRKVAYRQSPLRGPYIPSGSSNAISKKVHWDGPDTKLDDDDPAARDDRNDDNSGRALARRMFEVLKRTLLVMSHIQGLPTPPGKPILIPGEEDSQPDVVGIRWERSPSNGGCAIIGYHVEHRKMGSPNWVRSAPVLCTFPELTLSGLEPGWRYQFRIRAQNAVGLSEPSELSDPLTVTLQRTAALTPRFDSELKDRAVIEGEQAEFVAGFNGTPLPKICWFKDGFEIFSSRRTTITTDSGRSVLIIYRTTIDDEGEIKCSATNRAGHISTRAKLTVEAPPHVRIPRQYEDGLLFEQGETIRLKATNGGRPPPSITWYHDGEIINVDDRHRFESITDNESILKIQDAKRDDRGEYSIRAINKIGEDIAAFLVTVTDRPSAPGKPKLVGIVGSSVSLTWREPEDDGGCKIGTYIVEYYRVGWNVWLKATSCRQTATTLNELIEGSEYRFRIKAENPYGVSDSSENSDIVYIPDVKRGITESNLRNKSASHRDIPRGRSERRETSTNEPSQRTRSLTREEASSREATLYSERTSSVQRIGGGGTRPSRADSRVTFALDATCGEKDKPKKQRSKELLPQPQLENLVRTKSPQPAIVAVPNFNDSGGRFLSNNLSASRDRSPSPMLVDFGREEVVKNHSDTVDFATTSPPQPPRRRRNSIEVQESTSGLRSFKKEDEENLLHGSSEFMLVLFPSDENIKQGSKGPRREADRPSKTLERNPEKSSDLPKEQRSAVDSTDDENFFPPPMSSSLPELFSSGHQVIEIYREAVSSTELLHEHAMERFYRAVEAEKSAEQSRAKSQPVQESPQYSKRGRDPETNPLFGTRTRTVRRRLSNSGTSWQIKLNRRRSSEGQAKTFAAKASNFTEMGGVSPDTTSDPNLPTSVEMLAQQKTEPWLSGGGVRVGKSGGSMERLRRWHETAGIGSSNEASLAAMIDQENNQNRRKEELLKLPELTVKTIEPQRNEPYYDEVAPDTSEIMAEDSVETSAASSEIESTDSEDIKQLKARILAIPVIDEQDTYHPRGRMLVHPDFNETETPPPVPPHKSKKIDLVPPPIPDRTNLSPTNLTPSSSNSNIVPKSILKKRNENESITVNQNSKSAPPEKPMRKSLLQNDEVEVSSLIDSNKLSLEPSSHRVSSGVPNSDEIVPVSTARSKSPLTTPANFSPSSPTIPTAASSFSRVKASSATSSPNLPSSTTPRTTSSNDSQMESIYSMDKDPDKEAMISAGEAAVTKRKQMRQGSRGMSAEEEQEVEEEKMAVVSHYTELVKQYSSPDFLRQRSLSRDRDNSNNNNNNKRFAESPSDSRVASPIQSARSSVAKERRPSTPIKIVEQFAPIIPTTTTSGKIIEPIPPVMPTTRIQRAKPISAETRSKRRGSSSSSNKLLNNEPDRGLSRARNPKRDVVRDPRDASPDLGVSDNEADPTNYRPSSRNRTPSPRSAKSAKDPESPTGDFGRKRRRSSEAKSGNNGKSTSGLKVSRPSSRASSAERSRAGTPSGARSVDRSRQASTVIMGEVKSRENERSLRWIRDFFIDLGLLMAAVYVYFSKLEVWSIPIIIVLLFRQIQEELKGWLPDKWRQ